MKEQIKDKIALLQEMQNIIKSPVEAFGACPRLRKTNQGTERRVGTVISV